MDEKNAQDFIAEYLKGNHSTLGSDLGSLFGGEKYLAADWLTDDKDKAKDYIAATGNYIQNWDDDVEKLYPPDGVNYLSEEQKDVLEKYRDEIVIDFDGVKKHLVEPFIDRILTDGEYADEDKVLLNEIRKEYIEFNKKDTIKTEADKDDENKSMLIDLEASGLHSDDFIKQIAMMQKLFIK
jgi:hypothetical protein